MRVKSHKSGTREPARSRHDMPKAATPEALSQFAQNGAATAWGSYEKMSAVSAHASNLIQNSCAAAARGAVEYNAKLIGIAYANANAAFAYACALNGVRSPAQFLEVTSEHARNRFGAFTEQATELAALAQRLASEAAQPLTAGVTKALQGQVS